MHETIAQELKLDGQFSRSISLERDLHDKESLDGYLITPAVLTALAQIGTNLKAGHRQRAWKIIGPYGSGKSALALFLSRMFAGPRHARLSFAAVHDVAPEVEALFRPGRNLLSLAVTGARTSFGAALAKSVLSIVVTWRGSREASKLAKAIDLTGGTYRGQRLNAVTADLMRDFIDCAKAQAYDGVLLLVDELGKFVEHAALWPAEGDLIALQQVAEFACRSDDASLFVITMLHQHLADYATGVGRAPADEWHKVSGRFDEVAFDEPIQRYAHFAAHALGCSESLIRHTDIKRIARAAYRDAIAFGMLKSAGEADQALFAKAERLFPLHPAALSSMALVAKRMGQSERSFHAFLRGHEPFGVRDFAQRHKVEAGNWYSVEHLFDFLSQGARLRFRDLAAERRWTFATSAIEETAEKGRTGIAVLKALAVMELVRGVSRLPLTPKILAFALADSLALEQVKVALDEFRQRGILVSHAGSDSFSFAVNESLNVDAQYEAAASSSLDLRVSGLQQLLSENRIVASGHYHRTGTLRAVSLVVGSPDGNFAAAAGAADGSINVILVDRSRPSQRIAADALMHQPRSDLALWTSIDLDQSALAALEELSRWTFVKTETQNGALDPWTIRYVEGALTDARQRVEREVLAHLSAQVTDSPLQYYFNGQPVPNDEPRNLSQAASWMFDSVFTRCPIVINELINKDRPSAAIVLARQKLFEKLVNGSSTHDELFAENEFPPERLIYTTLLKNTGVHQGRTLFAESDSGPLASVWKRIEELLTNDEAVTYRSVLEQLSLPPYGIRQGVSSVWMVAYLVAHRDACAIFERQTLILELTADHLARMFKNPDAFKLRRFDGAGESSKLFQRYYTALASVGQGLAGKPTFLELSRALMRWYARLPQYSIETLQVSADAKLLRSTLKRATDPIHLLKEQVPAVFDCPPTSEAFIQRLTATLNEVGGAYRKLQEEVAAALGSAFSMSGPLSTIRARLQNECSGVAADLADVELRSFVLRCVDIAPVDDRWLDSIATLIVKRPMESWSDDSLPSFRESLADLCGRYKRWLKIAMEHGQHRNAAQRFMSFTVTAFGGSERSLVVAASPETKALADSLLNTLRDQVGQNPELLQAALLQALTDTFEVPVQNIGATG